MVSQSILSKKLFLLDAFALIYRAYYAFIRTPRYNSKGLNTSAVLGFTNTLLEVIEREKPTHIAVVFDPEGKTFRHDMYKEYKAQRPPMPEDIKKAIPYIKELLKGMQIPAISIDGYEADDVIGTLAKKAEQEGYTVYMMTPDKDYAQLVSNKIFMYKPKRSGKDVEIMGIKEVLESFGIEHVSQVIDILGLMGDSADNVPGCPGIGPKSATKLIAKYGDIQGLYNNVSDLKGKQKENVINNKEQVYLSRELVIIDTNVPNDVDISNLKRRDYKRDILEPLFSELEFYMIAEKMYGVIENTEELKDLETIDNSIFKIYTKELRDNLRADICIQNDFAFYTELSGDDPNTARPISISFCLNNNKCFHVNLPHDDKECREVIEEFRYVFEDKNIGKIAFDIKREYLWLRWYGIELKGDNFDIMLAHYLLHPEAKKDITIIAKNYWEYAMLGNKEEKQVQLALFSEEDNLSNNSYEKHCEQALVCYNLKSELLKKLIETGTNKVFFEIEMPLAEVLAEIEYNGVTIRKESLDDFSKELKERIDILENTIIDLAGEEFKVSSPKQLGEILFDKLKIDPKAKKTKTGQYLTSEQVLVKLKSKHKIIEPILDYRKLSKLENTYASTLHTYINKNTGRIHTRLNQADTATGRLSSANPNLQNIPIRTSDGRNVRRAFIASDENHIYMSADYSQIELRLMAHMSGDKGLIDAFMNKEDIHTITASKIYKVNISEVTQEMRRRAKTANFGIIYGISSWGLAERLDISRKEGKALKDGYFETYPKVEKYMEQCIELAREKEYVETIMGRRRYLKDINSRNSVVRGLAERNSINAPLQGSAADIIKMAMIKVYNRMKLEGLKSKMILQVHDELNFDCLKSEEELLRRILLEEMQDVVDLKVPLTIEVGVGINWLEAH